MEPFYKTYKPSLRGYYKLLLVVILILVLAAVASYTSAGASWLKFMWLAALVVDALILLYIFAQRATMSLILRDNPDKPEDQEVEFIKCHPLKPFSRDFRESIEIGLSNIVHIKVAQTMMQTLLKIGDVIIASSGTGAEEIQARNLLHPNTVRNEIQTHVQRYSAHVEA